MTSPEEIESRSLAGEGFKTVFNMHRIEKSPKLHSRLDRYDVMKYSAKRKKSWDELFISEKVLVLVARIKKKDAPGKFFKQSVQNISYFNKDGIYHKENSNDWWYKVLLAKKCPKQQKTCKKISKNRIICY